MAEVKEEVKEEETFTCWAKNPDDCCGLKLPIGQKCRGKRRLCKQCLLDYHHTKQIGYRKDRKANKSKVKKEVKKEETFTCWARNPDDCCGLKFPIGQKCPGIRRLCKQCLLDYTNKKQNVNRKANKSETNRKQNEYRKKKRQADPETYRKDNIIQKERYHNDEEYRQHTLQRCFDYYHKNKDKINKLRRNKYQVKRQQYLAALGLSGNVNIKPYYGYRETFFKNNIVTEIDEDYGVVSFPSRTVKYNNGDNSYNCDLLGTLRENIKVGEFDEKEHDSGNYPEIAEIFRETTLFDELTICYNKPGIFMPRINTHYQGFMKPMDELAKKLGPTFRVDHPEVIKLENQLIDTDIFNDIKDRYESEISYFYENQIKPLNMVIAYMGYSYKKTDSLKQTYITNKDSFVDIKMGIDVIDKDVVTWQFSKGTIV
eukprot:93611_1